MTTTTNNLSWINILKAFCMLLVFINHSEIYYGCSSALFGYFYRPIFVNSFFIVSGYLLFYHPWKGAKAVISNSIFRLVIPTMIMCAIFYLPKCFLRGQAIHWGDFLTATIGGGSIWFTMALAVAQLLIILLMCTHPQHKIVWAMYGSVLWIAAMYLMEKHITFLGSETMPWYYKSGMLAVPLLLTGGLDALYEKQRWAQFIHSPRWIPIWICIYGLLSYFLHSYSKTALDWQGLNMLGYLLSVIGFILLKSILIGIPSFPLTEWIGRKSIGFYFLCGSVVNVVAVMLLHFAPNGGYGFTLLTALVSFIIAIPVVWMIDRHIPFLFDLRKLNQ